MIGGYLYQYAEPEVSERLNLVLNDTYQRIALGASGLLFHDNPFADAPTAVYTSERLTMLSQDLLVSSNAAGEHAALSVQQDLPELFLRKQTGVFDEIVSDYRLIVVERASADSTLYLVSNRAGNGRLYYALLNSGILFASDLRFLLKVLPFEANDLAMYAILKYGATPEPMTISKNIAVVPPAHYLQYNTQTGRSQTRTYFQFDFPCDRQPPGQDFDAMLQPAKQALRQSAGFLRRYDPAILISGGIDSSLYAAYLHEFDDGQSFHGINCTFGAQDPERPFAQQLADRMNINLHVGAMDTDQALTLLQDTVALTGQPFSDFSSLPIVFILKYLNTETPEARMLIEGNGADDCFGFPDLRTQSKLMVKALFPGVLKGLLVAAFQNSKTWKWKSHEGVLARALAMCDVHERNRLNYFLVSAPVNFLRLRRSPDWDAALTANMDDLYARCGKNYESLSYEAKITIRQLLHINSRQWTAKAYSVGENLGIRVVYPYLWREILTLQGALPWTAKIHDGVVKWPLKRLLEEFMPPEFIYRQKSGFVPPFVQWLTTDAFNRTVRDLLLASDAAISRIVPADLIEELLDDARQGANLRFPVLNFLWGALFTEMWIRQHTRKE